MRATPTTVPIKTRMAGVIRLFSKEYFTRKTMRRKRTKPPIQANNFTPKNASQSKGFAGTGGGGAAGGGGGGGPGGGGAVRREEVARAALVAAAVVVVVAMRRKPAGRRQPARTAERRDAGSMERL